MDPFTIKRLLKLMADFKAKNGHDISGRVLEEGGFDKELVKKLVQKGLLKKFQVQNKNGSTENRYKVLKDWKSLNVD